MRRSLLDYFFENATNDKDAAFSWRPKLRKDLWTYARIARASFQFARELQDRGVSHGDRILLLEQNSPEWIAVFWGALLCGVVIVPLDEQSGSGFVERIAVQTTPKLLIKNHRSGVNLRDVPTLEIEELFHLLAQRSDEPFHPEQIEASRMIEIVFTSGTTGEPKGVELTHENLLANLEPIERVINRYIRWEFIVHPVRIMNTLPLSHVFGQILAVFIPTLLRAEVVFQNHLGPNEIIDSIKRDSIAVLAAAPRVLDNLRRKVEQEFETKGGESGNWVLRWLTHRDVHRMFGYKFIGFVTGGATLDIATEEFWNKLGFAAIQGYGMTETAALISLNNPFSARRGSLGQIIEGQEIRIADDGEILVRGGNVSKGYWGSDRRDDWIHTGDLGSVDDTGRLYFRGRKKDVIVTAAGLNIYPEDLEAVLNRQDAVIESAVIAVDGSNGPEPFAAIILHPEADPDETLEKANRELATFQQIRRWMIWPQPDFPRTPTLKVRKSEIAEFVSKNSSEPRISSTSIVSELVSRLAGSALNANSKLTRDLNLDSLSRVELISSLEDRYQIDIDERALTENTTVAELEERVRKSRGAEELPQFSFIYPRWPLYGASRWLRIVLYSLVVHPVARVLCRAKVEGLDNVFDLDGPILFASNHITRGDPALIMSVLPHRFRNRMAIAMDGEMLEGFRHPQRTIPFFTRLTYFLKYWAALIFFNVFPLPRLSGFRRSFSFAGEAMDRGFNVLIFPEGELTKDGKIAPFRLGVGLLADGLQCPVVPVIIEGLWELKQQGRRYYAPPGSVRITFDKPICFRQDETPANFTKRLERIITK